MRNDKALSYVKSEDEAGSIKIKLSFTSGNSNYTQAFSKEAEDSAEEESKDEFKIPQTVDGYK